MICNQNWAIYSYTTSHNKSSNKSSKHLSRSKVEWKGCSNLESKNQKINLKSNQSNINGINYLYGKNQIKPPSLKPENSSISK